MNIYITAKINEPEKVTLIQKAIALFGEQSGKYKVVASLEEIGNEDLILALGGDGTMVYSAKQALQRDCYVYGFNLGNLGFLTDSYSEFCWKEKLLNIVNHNFLLEERSLIQVDIEGTTYIAMNDLVLSPEKSHQMLKYQLFVGDRLASDYRANGVIISTATGSTAYSCSVGGSILEPECTAIQVLPIAPMSLSARSLVFSDIRHKPIKITSETSNLILTVDGQPIQLNNNVVLNSIRLVDKKVKFVHQREYDFYDILKKKQRKLN